MNGKKIEITPEALEQFRVAERHLHPQSLPPKKPERTFRRLLRRAKPLNMAEWRDVLAMPETSLAMIMEEYIFVISGDQRKDCVLRVMLVRELALGDEQQKRLKQMFYQPLPSMPGEDPCEERLTPDSRAISEGRRHQEEGLPVLRSYFHVGGVIETHNSRENGFCTLPEEELPFDPAKVIFTYTALDRFRKFFPELSEGGVVERAARRLISESRERNAINRAGVVRRLASHGFYPARYFRVGQHRFVLKELEDGNFLVITVEIARY